MYVCVCVCACAYVCTNWCMCHYQARQNCCVQIMSPYLVPIATILMSDAYPLGAYDYPIPVTPARLQAGIMQYLEHNLAKCATIV